MKIENNVLLTIDIKDLVDGILYIPNGVKEIAPLCCAAQKGLKKVVMPKSVKVIGNKAFWYNDDLEEIDLSSNLAEIGGHAFYNCAKLKEIVIPKKVRKINEKAFEKSGIEKIQITSKKLKEISQFSFANCSNLCQIVTPASVPVAAHNAFAKDTNLENVILGKNVQAIGDDVFSGCTKLKNITLSKKLINIGDRAFFGSALENVEFNKKLDKIGVRAFAKTNIKELRMPNSVTVISSEMCANCKNLQKVILSSNIASIPSGAFSTCINLKSINIEKNVREIESFAFANCTSLRTMDLSKSVSTFGEKVFFCCTNLQKVKLSNSVTHIPNGMFYNCPSLLSVDNTLLVSSIGDSAFAGCVRLTQLQTTEYLQKIGKKTFKNCYHLQNFNISKNIEVIEESTFENCMYLQEVSIPNVRRIENNAFQNCFRLRICQTGEELKVIDKNAFSGCKKLHHFSLPTEIFYIGERALPFYTIIKHSDGFEFCNNVYGSLRKIGNVIKSVVASPNNILFINPKNYGEINLLLRCWDNKEKLLQDIKRENVRYAYQYYYDEMDSEKFVNFVKNADNKFCDVLLSNCKNMNDNNKKAILKLFYNLGGYVGSVQIHKISKKGNEQDNSIDYSQKVAEFIKRQIKDKSINWSAILANMELDGFKKEYSDFILKDDNFVELMKREIVYPNTIARSYNEFDDIQRTNSSNKGNQRQLKPTVKVIVNYFLQNRYNDITPETEKIAELFDKFKINQRGFDIAKEINQTRKQNHIPDNIFSVDSANNDLLDSVHQANNNVAKISNDILQNEKNFEYQFEWLKKSDPINFMLGKYCNCCAHINGNGFGIMNASIIRPDVQNLVVKNQSGEIIAKATMYINKDERYGVINTFEVSNKEKNKEEIFNAFLRGIDYFVKIYDQINKTNTIEKIAVGMKNNSLVRQVNKISLGTSNLEGIDFSEYGIGKKSYFGDWLEQKLIYQKDKTLNFNIEDSEKEM